MTYRAIPKNAPLATNYLWDQIQDFHVNSNGVSIMDRHDWSQYHCSWCGWQIEPQYEDYFSSDSYHAHEYCHNKHCFGRQTRSRPNRPSATPRQKQ